MWRSIGIILLGSLLAGTAMAESPAVALLRQHLQRAQQREALRQVEYRFTTRVEALGRSDTQTFRLKEVQTADESYFLAELQRPTKILFDAESLCTKTGAGWTCDVIDHDTFEKNLRSPNMALYPPTAMSLVEQLVTRYPRAVTVTAAGSAQVARRTCDVFRVAVDGARVGPAVLSRHLYVAQDDGRLLPYVTGTTLQLCFDRATGQVLKYRNELVLDQVRMRADGFGAGEPAFATQPVGVLRGGFVAERVEEASYE